MSMIAMLRLAPGEDIDRLLASPEAIEDFLEEGGEDPSGSLDVDKAWHGLHFLLTGTAWDGTSPLDFIVAGGEMVGDVDVGYGPARAFRPRDLKAIARAIEPFDEAELRRRFDPARMKKLEIYPDIWGRPPDEDDTLGYLIENWSLLKPFIQKGAADGFGMIVWLA